uniref:YhhN-like protein n=1 Tax=Panagrolaimus sp. JU765 TaxID=591449 RepID=A0AC34QSI7_9BILA
MIILNRWQMFVIYGVTLLLVHISTNGFKTNAPLFSVAPLASLILMTFGTTMAFKKKLGTAGSFAAIAFGVYYWALLPRHIFARALLFSLSSVLYLWTFVFHVKKVWRQLAIAVGIYSVGLLYYCIGDLYRSVPFLVFGISLDMLMISVTIVAAGSLWKYGVKGQRLHEAKSAALIRFMGLLIELICGSAILYNHFLKHHNFHQYMLLYYVAQFLLFLANEQTF